MRTSRPAGWQHWTEATKRGMVAGQGRMTEKSSRKVQLLRAAGAAIALLILWVTFRKVDGALVLRTLRSLGPWILLVPLPELGWILAESLGWRWAFAVLGRKVSVGPLFRVRLCMEAISTTLPGGVLLSESMVPYLLKRHAGVPMAEGVTAVLARKFLLLGSQAIYMLLMFVCGAEALARSSPQLLGRPGLEWLVLGSAVFLGIGALGVRLSLHRGALVTRIYGLLRRIPSRRWQHYLADKENRFLQTDNEMARFFGTGKRRLSIPSLPFLAAWLIESLETWMLLRLVGVELDFITVASFEAVVVLLFRHVMFFLPAGLGAQDAGYVAFLAALGVENPVSLGAAFVVLKRSKELLWAAAGFLMLLADRRRPLAETALPTESAEAQVP